MADIEPIVAPAVREALAAGRPVVALETSILAHGLPQPLNLETYRDCVAAVQSEGAAAAPVAVLDGRVRVGLEDAEIERLGWGGAEKCGARDIAALVATGGDGGTTVSGTLRIAARAGIAVFATGGLGGVHPPAHGIDVSADLLELSRRPVAVVASGAKSILDLPATLEALEALSVPVLGWRCDAFPAFYAGDSGLPVAHRFDDQETLAAAVRGHWRIEGGGVLICNPPPAETALEAAELERMVATAQAKAKSEGVHGAELTPYLLARLAEASGGRSLTVNRALAVANARLGAMLATALAGYAGGGDQGRAA